MLLAADHKRVKLFAKKLVASVPKEHLREVTGERVKKMILDMLQEPLNFQLLLEHCCAGISSTIAWGDKSPETASETVDRSNQLLEGISPESIENKLPFLEKVPEWVPGFLQPWRVFERARAARERAFWLGQREQTKEKLINEKDLYTWTKESLKDETLNEEEKAYTVGMLALIGGVLESAPIQGWFVAMVKFPEWQKRGQEEVDAVCGDRMPNAADIQKLPVVRSLLRETFRWRTPVPFGRRQSF
jgi:cytochrome P450